MKEKTKSVQINEQVHNMAKLYCEKKFLKLGKFIEKLILKEVKDSNE